MANEINLPIKLHLENLKDIMKSMQSELGNLKVDSTSYKKLSAAIADMEKRIQQLQVAAARPFVDAKQFTDAQREVQKIEDDVTRVRLEASKIKFSDLSLNASQTERLQEFQKKIKEINDQLKQVKESAKEAFLKTDIGKAWKENNQEASTGSLAQVTKAIEKEVAKQEDALKRAKQAYTDYQNTLKVSQNINKFMKGGHNLTETLKAEGMYDQIFNKEGNFRSGGRGTLERWFQTEFNLSPEVIDTLVRDAGKKVQDAFAQINGEVEKTLKQEKARLNMNATDARKETRGGKTLTEGITQAEASRNAAAATQSALNEEKIKSIQIEQQLQAEQEKNTQKFEEWKSVQVDAARNNGTLNQSLQQVADGVRQVSGALTEGEQKISKFDEATNKLSNISNFINRYIGVYAIVRKVIQGIKSAINTIKELDQNITNIAVVTNMSQEQLWGKIGEYTAMASQYGVATKEVYTVSQIFYQQGLQTAQVMSLTTETLKMAKISGMEYADAANAMTVAVRAFNIEMSQAQQVTDTYSALAAKFAVSSAEIANAMEKTASSAANVGMSLQSTSAFISVMEQTTRESAQNIGSALKSIISRYGEMKASPNKILNIDGEDVAFNKVDTALKSVGISIKDAAGQFRDFDDVIMELAKKWNTLDNNTQRYIATIMAGNRQQSRFIALVSNYDELNRAMQTANNAENASIIQVGKTMDSLETKAQKLKNAFSQLYLDLHIEKDLKNAYEYITQIIKTIGKLGMGKGVLPTLASIFSFGTGAKSLINQTKDFIKTKKLNLDMSQAKKEIQKFDTEASKPIIKQVKLDLSNVQAAEGQLQGAIDSNFSKATMALRLATRDSEGNLTLSEADARAQLAEAQKNGVFADPQKRAEFLQSKNISSDSKQGTILDSLMMKLDAFGQSIQDVDGILKNLGQSAEGATEGNKEQGESSKGAAEGNKQFAAATQDAVGAQQENTDKIREGIQPKQGDRFATEEHRVAVKNDSDALRDHSSKKGSDAESKLSGINSLMSGLSSVLRIIAPSIIAKGASHKDTSDELINEGVEKSKYYTGIGNGLSGAGTGMSIGSSIGGAIGSLFMPGLGTAIGSFAGSLLGGPIGFLVSGLGAIKDALEVTTDEIVAVLNEEAEAAQEASLKKQAETLDLEQQISNLKALKKIMYDSQDNMDAYKKAMNEMAEQYPDLVSQYDAAGNAIIDLIAAEKKLMVQRSDAAKHAKEAAEINIKAYDYQIQGTQKIKDKIDAQEQRYAGRYVYDENGEKIRIQSGITTQVTRSKSMKSSRNRITTKHSYYKEDKEIDPEKYLDAALDWIYRYEGLTGEYEHLKKYIENPDLVWSEDDLILWSKFVQSRTSWDGKKGKVQFNANSTTGQYGAIDLDEFLSWYSVKPGDYGETSFNEILNSQVLSRYVQQLTDNKGKNLTTSLTEEVDPAVVSSLNDLIIKNQNVLKTTATTAAEYFHWSGTEVSLAEIQSAQKQIDNQLKSLERARNNAIMQSNIASAQAYLADNAMVSNLSVEQQDAITSNNTYARLIATRMNKRAIDLGYDNTHEWAQAENGEEELEAFSIEASRDIIAWYGNQTQVALERFEKAMSNTTLYLNAEDLLKAAGVSKSQTIGVDVAEQFAKDQEQNRRYILEAVFSTNDQGEFIQVANDLSSGLTLLGDNALEIAWGIGQDGKLVSAYSSYFTSQLMEINELAKQGQVEIARARLDKLYTVYDELVQAGPAIQRDLFNTVTNIQWDSLESIEAAEKSIRTYAKQKGISENDSRISGILTALNDAKGDLIYNVNTLAQNVVNTVKSMAESLEGILSTQKNGLSLSKALEEFDKLQATLDEDVNFEDIFEFDAILGKYVYSENGLQKALAADEKRMNDRMKELTDAKELATETLTSQNQSVEAGLINQPTVNDYKDSWYSHFLWASNQSLVVFKDRMEAESQLASAYQIDSTSAGIQWALDQLGKNGEKFTLKDVQIQYNNWLQQQAKNNQLTQQSLHNIIANQLKDQEEFIPLYQKLADDFFASAEWPEKTLEKFIEYVNMHADDIDYVSPLRTTIQNVDWTKMRVQGYAQLDKEYANQKEIYSTSGAYTKYASREELENALRNLEINPSDEGIKAALDKMEREGYERNVVNVKLLYDAWLNNQKKNGELSANLIRNIIINGMNWTKEEQKQFMPIYENAIKDFLADTSIVHTWDNFLIFLEKKAKDDEKITDEAIKTLQAGAQETKNTLFSMIDWSSLSLGTDTTGRQNDLKKLLITELNKTARQLNQTELSADAYWQDVIDRYLYYQYATFDENGKLIEFNDKLYKEARAALMGNIKKGESQQVSTAITEILSGAGTQLSETSRALIQKYRLDEKYQLTYINGVLDAEGEFINSAIEIYAAEAGHFSSLAEKNKAYVSIINKSFADANTMLSLLSNSTFTFDTLEQNLTAMGLTLDAYWDTKQSRWRKENEITSDRLKMMSDDEIIAAGIGLPEQESEDYHFYLEENQQGDYAAVEKARATARAAAERNAKARDAWLAQYTGSSLEGILSVDMFGNISIDDWDNYEQWLAHEKGLEGQLEQFRGTSQRAKYKRQWIESKISEPQDKQFSDKQMAKTVSDLAGAKVGDVISVFDFPKELREELTNIGFEIDKEAITISSTTQLRELAQIYKKYLDNSDWVELHPQAAAAMKEALEKVADNVTSTMNEAVTYIIQGATKYSDISKFADEYKAATGKVLDANAFQYNTILNAWTLDPKYLKEYVAKQAQYLVELGVLAEDAVEDYINDQVTEKILENVDISSYLAAEHTGKGSHAYEVLEQQMLAAAKAAGLDEKQVQQDLADLNSNDAKQRLAIMQKYSATGELTLEQVEKAYRGRVETIVGVINNLENISKNSVVDAKTRDLLNTVKGFRVTGEGVVEEIGNLVDAYQTLFEALRATAVATTKELNEAYAKILSASVNQSSTFISVLSSGRSIDISTLTNLFTLFDLQLENYFDARTRQWRNGLEQAVSTDMFGKTKIEDWNTFVAALGARSNIDLAELLKTDEYLAARSQWIDTLITEQEKTSKTLQTQFVNATSDIKQWKKINVSQLGIQTVSYLAQNGAAEVKNGILTITNTVQYAKNVLSVLSSLDNEQLTKMGLTSADLAIQWNAAQGVLTAATDAWRGISSNLTSLKSSDISTLIEKGGLTFDDLTSPEMIQRVGDHFVMVLNEYSEKLKDMGIPPEEVDSILIKARKAIIDSLKNINWSNIFSGKRVSESDWLSLDETITDIAIALGIQLEDIYTIDDNGYKVLNVGELQKQLESSEDEIAIALSEQLATTIDGLTTTAISELNTAAGFAVNGTTDISAMRSFAKRFQELTGSKTDINSMFSYNTSLGAYILDFKIFNQYKDAQRQFLQSLGLSTDAINKQIESQVRALTTANMDLQGFINGGYLNMESKNTQQLIYSLMLQSGKNSYEEAFKEAKKLLSALLIGGQAAVKALKQIKGEENLSADEIKSVYRSAFDRLYSALEFTTSRVGDFIDDTTAAVFREAGATVQSLGNGQNRIIALNAENEQVWIDNLVNAYIRLYRTLERTAGATVSELNKAYAKILTAGEIMQSRPIEALQNATSMTYEQLGEILAQYGIKLEDALLHAVEYGIGSIGAGKIRIFDFEAFASKMGWDTNSEEYLSGFKTYKDSMIELDNKTRNEIVKEVKSVSSAKVGDQLNLTYLWSKLDKTQREAEYNALHELGAEIVDGILTITSGAKLPQIIQEITRLASDNANLLPSELAELADAVENYIKQIADLINKAIHGTLSNVEAQQLTEWAEQFDIQLDFTRTQDGLKLSIDSAIQLYNELKQVDALQAQLVFDELNNSLKETNEHYKSVSDIMNRIAWIEDEKHPERINQYKEELALAKEILAVRSTTEDSSFNFMSNKIPGGQNNPLNYAANWTTAFGKIKDAFDVNKVKKNGKTGFINYTDWYNIVTEMNNIAALGGPIELAGYTLDGSLTSAAKLIEAGADALTTVDTGELKVELGSIGTGIASAGELMNQGVTDGIKAMAHSQVEMLDGLIAMMELIVSMQELGDIDVEGNGIDFGDFFEFDENEAIIGFSQGYSDWIKYCKKEIEADNQDLINVLNGIKLGDWSLMDILKFTPTDLNDAKDQLGQVYPALMQALYKAAQSNDWDPDHIGESMMAILKEQGFDGTIPIEMGDTTLMISANTVTTIDWKGKTSEQVVKAWMEAYTATETEAKDALTNLAKQYHSGKTLKPDELKFVLALEGHATIDSDGTLTSVTVKGKKYEDKNVLTRAMAAISVEDFLSEEQLDTLIKNGEPVSIPIGVDGKVQFQINIDENNEIEWEYNGTKANSQQALLDILWNDYADGKPFFTDKVARRKWEWEEFHIRAPISGKIILDGSEVNVEDQEIKTKIEAAIKSPDIVENMDKTYNADGTWTINYEGMEFKVAGDENAGEQLNASIVEFLSSAIGIDSTLVTSITTSITAAFESPSFKNAITEAISNAIKEGLEEGTKEGANKANVSTDIFGLFAEKVGEKAQKAFQGFGGLFQNRKNSSSGTEPETPEVPDASESINAAAEALNKLGESALNAQDPTSKFSEKINDVQASAEKAKQPVQEFTSAVGTTGTRALIATIPVGLFSSAVGNAGSNASSSRESIAKLADAIKNIPEKTTHEIQLNISATASSSDSKGNVTLQSITPSLIAAASFAKGSARAGGQSTLMGELGPELVVSNGSYFIVGQGGAEFVDLAPDAIVFNHKQTASLLSSGKSGRGKPVTNENNAISWAKGNLSGGPAMASASAALAALKQLRAEWKALEALSVQDLAGKAGGGGGGGGNDKKAFIKDLEKWYDWMQQIAQIEKQINLEEAKRTKYQNDMVARGREYYTSQQASLKYLKDQLTVQKSLNKSQQAYFDNRVKELNEEGAFRALYGFSDSGQLYYKDVFQDNKSAFEWLSDLAGRNSKTGEANYTAKQQYDKLVAAGYGFAMEYDSSGNEIDKKKDGWENTAVQAFWDKIEADKEEMQKLHDQLEEGNKKLYELENEQNEILHDIEDNQIDVEQKVLKAVEEIHQRAIDDAKDERDAIEAAAKALTDGLTEQLNNEKELFNDQTTADELAKLQRQLAILRRSGGSAAQIANLENQISDKQKDIYFDAQQDQIDALKDASDAQIERLDHQIDIMEQTLAYQKEYGLLWNEVADVLGGSAESILEFIRGNTEEYWSKSNAELTKTLREDLFKIERYLQEVAEPAEIEIDTDETDTTKKTSTSTGGSGSAGESGGVSGGSGSGSKGSGAGAASAKKKVGEPGPWSYDAKKHWRMQEWTVGQPTKVDEGAHSFVQQSDGYKLHNKCKICGYDAGYIYEGGAQGLSASSVKDMLGQSAIGALKKQGKSTAANTINGKVSFGQGLAITSALSSSGTSSVSPNVRLKLSTNDRGGYTDETGIELVHKGEAVLTQSQTRVLRNNILGNRPDSLVNLLSSYNEAYHGLSSATYDSISNTSASTVIEKAEVNLNVQELANDYDAKRAASTIMDEMLRIASKTKANNSVRR